MASDDVSLETASERGTWPLSFACCPSHSPDAVRFGGLPIRAASLGLPSTNGSCAGRTRSRTLAAGCSSRCRPYPRKTRSSSRSQPAGLRRRRRNRARRCDFVAFLGNKRERLFTRSGAERPRAGRCSGGDSHYAQPASTFIGPWPLGGRGAPRRKSASPTVPAEHAAEEAEVHRHRDEHEQQREAVRGRREARAREARAPRQHELRRRAAARDADRVGLARDELGEEALVRARTHW